MCGIAGFMLIGGEVDKTELTGMAQALRHRGTDDLGVYRNGSVGLVHTRLSIVDLDHGQQPLLDASNHLALVANGEIYNHLELRDELINRGCRFTTRSDSETLLHAYAQFGRRFVERVHGMFAFALHDARRKRVILARDRLGIKPLFIAQLPDRIAFASELKALVPLLPRPIRVNPEALLQYLQNGCSSGRSTMLSRIQRVLPGEMVQIDIDLRIRRTRYWSLGTIRPQNIDLPEAIDAFDQLMSQVMREHIRADVPYGLFLSGGVDSAALLAWLARYQDRPIRTFSIGYTRSRYENELDDAQRIADLFHTEHTAIEVEPERLYGRIPQMIWAADDLIYDPACLPTLTLAQAASRHLKVVFTGEGGDETFAGYGGYRRSALQRFLRMMVSPGCGGFYKGGKWSALVSFALFGDALSRVSQSAQRPFLDHWRSAPSSWKYIRRAQFTDLNENLPNKLLVKADRSLMAYGIEGRVPFLDHRIVAFGLSLPDRLKVYGKNGKFLLKRWAEQELPPDHLYKRKRGFRVPLEGLFQGRFLTGLEKKLRRSAVIRQWFKPEGISDLFRIHRKTHNAIYEISAVMFFAIWHRLFVECAGEIPTSSEDPLNWIS